MFAGKEGASSLYQYTQVPVQLDGQPPVCEGCGVDMCLQMCADNDACTALDFSFADRTCYLHHRVVMCREQNRTGDPNHLHAQKNPCQLRECPKV